MLINLFRTKSKNSKFYLQQRTKPLASKKRNLWDVELFPLRKEKLALKTLFFLFSETPSVECCTLADSMEIKQKLGEYLRKRQRINLKSVFSQSSQIPLPKSSSLKISSFHSQETKIWQISRMRLIRPSTISSD